jgi:gamma-glutamylaminecyclotransferase
MSLSPSPSPSTSHRVFVYGTLKRGLHNHVLLERARASFVGPARTTRASFAMLLADAGYPYVVKTTTNARAIEGEVYVVDDDTLERLDALEEIATGMYSRESVEVTMTATSAAAAAETTVVEAFWYLAGSRDDLERLPRIDAYDKRIHDEMYVPKHLRG